MTDGDILPDTLPERLSADRAGFLADPSLQRLFDAIEAAGGEARINGGAVRNALLGVPVADTDLSTTLEPEHLVAALEKAGIKPVATGIEHGTVTAVIDGVGHEVTTLREDIETDGRRAVVRFGTDWKADAARRDFTMNALYCDRTGLLFDPLDGYPDLAARNVRFIGDPDQRIAEDRLRILRFFRFFAWYGSARPDAAGLKACARHKGELAQLSAERLWHETKRLLSAPDPGRALLWMRQTGVLTVLLPETEKWGIDLIPPLIETEREHGWKADPMIRLMAMIPPRGERTLQLSTRLKLSQSESRRLEKWTQQQALTGTESDLAISQAVYRQDRQPVTDQLQLLVANARRPDATANASLEQIKSRLALAQSCTLPSFPVSGGDLKKLGYKPGPQMGELLAELEQRWLDSGFTLSRDALLAGLEAK